MILFIPFEQRYLPGVDFARQTDTRNENYSLEENSYQRIYEGIESISDENNTNDVVQTSTTTVSGRIRKNSSWTVKEKRPQVSWRESTNRGAIVCYLYQRALGRLWPKTPEPEARENELGHVSTEQYTKLIGSTRAWLAGPK